MTERKVTEEELRVWRAVILAPNRDIVKKLQGSASSPSSTEEATPQSIESKAKGGEE